MARTGTLEGLAVATATDPADLAVIISSLAAAESIDLSDGIPEDMITAVHFYLNPFCERTVPWLWGQTGEDV